MSKKEIFGSFYLSLTDSGNLLGEYTHKDIDQVFTESAILYKTNSKKTFVGEYYSSWIEAENTPFSVDSFLVIEFRNNSQNRKYYLEWRQANGNVIFKGDGFLVDGKLIGCYWN